MTDPDPLLQLEAEIIALRAALVGFAALFPKQAERADIVLRDAAERMLVSQHADVGHCRAVAQASIRLADQLAEHCAYLDSLDREGRGIR